MITVRRNEMNTTTASFVESAFSISPVSLGDHAATAQAETPKLMVLPELDEYERFTQELLGTFSSRWEW
jgi:hypothetical protein